MGRPKPEVPLTLRNFRLPDDLYYQFEFIAAQHNRTVTGHLTFLMQEKVYEEQEKHGWKDNKMKTKSRQEKLKQQKS